MTDYADKIILLLLGQDDLVEISDPRLKKDIRLAYPLLDGLICQIDEVPVWLITDFPVYSLSFSKLPEIQKQIDFWSDRLETPYVAIVQDNEIISMKPDFGEQLDYIEINIIAYCASVYSDKALVELPVYLYKLAPDNAYRLILIKLFGNTSMVALCGSVTNLTTSKGRSPFQELKICSQIHATRYFPTRATEEFRQRSQGPSARSHWNFDSR